MARISYTVRYNVIQNYNLSTCSLLLLQKTKTEAQGRQNKSYVLEWSLSAQIISISLIRLLFIIGTHSCPAYTRVCGPERGLYGRSYVQLQNLTSGGQHSFAYEYAHHICLHSAITKSLFGDMKYSYL